VIQIDGTALEKSGALPPLSRENNVRKGSQKETHSTPMRGAQWSLCAMSEHELNPNENPPRDGDHGTGSNQDHQADGPERDSSSDVGKQGNPPPRDRKGGFDPYPHGEQEYGEHIDSYFYNLADGEPYLLVKRFERIDENGKKWKNFPQYHYVQTTPSRCTVGEGSEKNWIPGPPNGPKIPYYLSELIAAPKDAFVYIPEGERDAESIADCHLIATTSSGGATKDGWTDDLNQWFEDRICIVVRDNDGPGKRFARRKMHALRSIAKRVVCIDFGKYKDVTEYLKATYGADYHSNPEAQADLLRRAQFALALDELASLPLEQFDAAKEAFYKEWKIGKRDLNKLITDYRKERELEDREALEDEEEDSGQPRNFIMTETELRYRTKGSMYRVCDAFEVLGECRDANGMGWGLMLRFNDRDGKSRTHHVNFNTLHSDANAVCADLSCAGLAIEFHRHRELATYLCAVKVEGRLRIVTRPGWIVIDDKRAFALTHGIIGHIEGENIVADFKSNHKQKGTLDQWKNGIATLVIGHFVPMLAVASSFVGPLLDITGEESGGVHFHGLSGKGKTTILSAAASSWGNGAQTDAYMKSWSTTMNGLESYLVACRDTCIVLDEINQGDSRVISQAAYQISNGTGKQRMNRNLTMRDAASWKTWLVSSGEVTTEQKIIENKDKVMAGQLSRILDIPADRGLGFGVFDHGGPENSSRKLSEAIVAAASSAYGTAGPEFVRNVIERRTERIAQEAIEYRESFIVKCRIADASHQVARVAKKFALIAFAGKLAVEFGILPWEASAPEQAALWMFKRWMAQRGGKKEEATEEIQAVRHVQYLMEQHGDSRFQEVKENAYPVNNRLGFRKSDGHGKWEYWILPETWREDFCKGFDPTQVAEWLEKRGMLRKPGGERGFQSKRDLGGGRGKHQRVYILTSAVLEDQPTPPDRETEEM
jgi:uncharacterized protein (DUF927 family)